MKLWLIINNKNSALREESIVRAPDRNLACELAGCDPESLDSWVFVLNPEGPVEMIEKWHVNKSDGLAIRAIKTP